MDNAKTVTTPIDPNVKLDSPDEDQNKFYTQGENDDIILFGFAALIGCLMYLALGTCLDIAYAVTKLAQHTSNPKSIHWTALKCIFRYLKGTRHYSVTYGGEDHLLNENLNIYCDADWANDVDRKSTSGYIVTMAGGAIAWSSKKQFTVALSTAEAEYIAATHAAKQVLWHKSLFKELDLPLPTTSTVRDKTVQMFFEFRRLLE